MDQKDSQPLLKSQEDQQTSNWDIVMIFRNPYDIESANYKANYFKRQISLEKAKSTFERIFNLDEKDQEDMEDFAQIQKGFESIDSLAVDGQLDYQVLCQLIFQNVVHLLQDIIFADINVFYSRDYDDIYIKIRMNEENLKVAADLFDYLIQFKPQPDEIYDFQQVPPFAPFEKMTKIGLLPGGGRPKFQNYLNFDDNDQKIPKNGSLFASKDRIRLIYYSINNEIDIGALFNSGLIYSFLCLNNNQHKVLKDSWGSFTNILKFSNLDLVRDYMGEKIAMYFAWIQFFIMWLILPSIFGLVFFIVRIISDDIDDKTDELTASEISVLIYVLLLATMTTFMDQLWDREQKKLAWKWGTHGLKHFLIQRPQFEGEYVKDPISGKMKKKRLSDRMHRVKKTISISVSLFFVLLVLAFVTSIFLYRATLDKDGVGPKLCALLNAIQIKVMNFIYKYVATWLNNWENYETDSKYYDGLTIKLFMFQFVNSYVSLFYIAFIKDMVEGCDNGDCMGELQLQLGIIFITNMALNIIELGIPYLKTKISIYLEQRRMNTMESSRKLNKIEKQAKLQIYESPLDDYMECVINFGFVVLFSSSFMLCPLLCIILLLVEIRVDAWKLTNLTRRPFPEQASSIGIWLEILQGLAITGVISNTGIIVFTATIFDTDAKQKWELFILIEHLMLFFKFVLASYIPNTPTIVKRGLEWQKRVVDERVYGRLVDSDKERKIKQLFFKPTPNRPEIAINSAEDINDRDEEQ